MHKPPISMAELRARKERGAEAKAGRLPSALPTGLTMDAIRRERARTLKQHERHSAPITRVIPVPRSIELGGDGRRYTVSEMRLRDLADLQAYLEEVEPNPLDSFPPPWADPDPDTRPARLAALKKRAAEWPPRLMTERGRTILGSSGGRTYFLTLLVRRHRPDFGIEEARDLLEQVTPTQWATLWRIAWAITPLAEIAAEQDTRDEPDRPIDWCQQLHYAAGDHAATAYPHLGELTLGQWRNLCAAGKSSTAQSDKQRGHARVKRPAKPEGGG